MGEIGEACSKHENVKKCMLNFGQKDMRPKNISGPKDILDDNLKMSRKQTGCGFVGNSYLMHNENQWLDLVLTYTEMNLQVL